MWTNMTQYWLGHVLFAYFCVAEITEVIIYPFAKEGSSVIYSETSHVSTRFPYRQGRPFLGLDGEEAGNLLFVTALHIVS